jgi:sugar phosphate isomerase/epimerase
LGDRIGCRIGLDVGLEPAGILMGFLKSFDSGSLGVSVDPAALLMERLPMELTLRTLAGTVLHTYARDAAARKLDRSAREVSLGAGDVDWFSWLRTLEEIGYKGWLTIRQEAMAEPGKELASAVGFLRKLGVGRERD